MGLRLLCRVEVIDNNNTDAGKLALIRDLLETNQTGFSNIEQEWNDFKSGLESDAELLSNFVYRKKSGDIFFIN